MELSPVFLHIFHNKIERVLHIKGNFTGPVLEMALVMDYRIPAKQMQESVGALLRCLKQQSEVFRNVRFNVIDWRSDSEITTKVCPMLSAVTEGFYQDYEQIEEAKRIEKLYQYLKFYHARSKLVLLITDGQYRIENEAEKEAALKPFLGRKLIEIKITEKGIELG